MRFDHNDWWRLVVASAGAALVMAVVTWASGAILHAVAPPTPNLMIPLMMATGVIGALADALAMWLVLRRCVAGLLLGPWLLAVALGIGLAAVVSLPAWALSMSMRATDLLSLNGDPVHLLARWLNLIAVAVAPLLPPRILLQRLSGASAWPFVGVGAIAAIFGRLAIPTAMPWVLRFMFIIVFTMHDTHTGPLAVAALAGAFAVVSGALYGLTIGAGLFLMARRPLRPAPAT